MRQCGTRRRRNLGGREALPKLDGTGAESARVGNADGKFGLLLAFLRLSPLNKANFGVHVCVYVCCSDAGNDLAAMDFLLPAGDGGAK